MITVILDRNLTAHINGIPVVLQPGTRVDIMPANVPQAFLSVVEADPAPGLPPQPWSLVSDGDNP